MTMRCDVAGVEAPVTVLSSHRTSTGGIWYVRCHCGGVTILRTDPMSGGQECLHHVGPHAA